MRWRGFGELVRKLETGAQDVGHQARAPNLAGGLAMFEAVVAAVSVGDDLVAVFV